MSNFFILLFNFTVLVTVIQADLIQMYTDLVGGLSSTGWSVYKTSTILTAVEESKDGCLGPYDASSPATQKTYGGSFPPHWSLSVDVFAWQMRTWDAPDFCTLKLDGIAREIAFKVGSSDQDFLGGGANNVDQLKIFHVNITHTAASVLFRMEANLDQSYPDEWLCFNNIRIWIDTCDETCASCNGPAPNQCTSCPSGATLSGGTCKCAGSQYAKSNSCVSCPAGYWGDPNLKKCVPACLAGSNNCLSCLDERHCGACSGGMVSYLGDCVSSCPWFYDNISGICQPLEKSFTNGKTIYAGLDGIIDKTDESTFSYSFTTSYNLQQKFYVCSNGERMIGGFDGAGFGNTIQYNPGTIPYHHRVRIKVKANFLDSWDNEFFQVIVSGTIVISQQYIFSASSTNYCGLTQAGWNDERYSFDATFAHSGTTLPISFESTLNEPTVNESFGISNLIIVIDQCPNQLCTTCNATVCFTCVAGAFLNNSNICVNPCPNGQFGNAISGRCEVCSYKCSTCSGSATSCTSCDPARGASATLPNCDCITGQYDNPPSPTCKQCSYKCTACTTSASNCTDCAANRLDTAVPGCACPVGTYDDGTNGLCPACNFVCATCSGSASNCLTCKGDRIRAPTCECPEGYFDDGVSFNCQACNPKCRTCTGNANNCTSCSSNRIMPACNCPSTHYDDGTVICKVCSYQCITCTGSATNCTSCAGNRLAQIPTCPCPVGMNEAGYANCVVCDPKCDQCSTVDKNCVSCSGNRSQNPPFCTCPIGTYETNLANCPSCSYKCSSCTIIDTNCTACSHVSRITTPTCNCKDGYYEKGSIDCGVCPKKCITCKSATECVTCSANRQNAPECTCKDGYYEDANGDCQPCNSSCTRCTGPSSSDCDTCSGNRIDFPTCRCPLGTYDNGLATCPSCNLACTQCSAGTVNDCISCSGNKIYDSVSKKCVCPTNTYDLGTEYFCAQCNPLCNGCTSTNICIACAANRVGLSLCSQCPDGTYDNGGLQCAACNTTICSTCSQLSTNCTTCAAGRVNAPTCKCAAGTFDNGISCEKCDKMCSACDKTSKNCTQCVAGRSDPPNCTCDDGTYDDGVNVTCQKCQNQCVTCTGVNTCTSCRGDRISAPACNCPYGMFDDGISENCRVCDFQCNSCSGSSSNCSSCKGNRINFPSCNCPPGYYETGEYNCQPCNKQCGTCLNSSENCLTCSGIRINPPECSCPAQTYYDQVKNDCINCYKTCISCNGSQSTQCIQCLSGFVMRDSECKGPIGTYVDFSTNTVRSCISSCLECETAASFCIKCNPSKHRKLSGNSCICIDGYSENSSSECVANAKPIVNKCSIENNAYGIISNTECECQEGEYLVISTGKCLPCFIQSCKHCTATKCLDCKDGYTFTADGNCIRIITDQSPEILFSIFSFITLGFGVTIGVICFLKWQYKLMKGKGFQKLEQSGERNGRKKKIIMDESYQEVQYL